MFGFNLLASPQLYVTLCGERMNNYENVNAVALALKNQDMVWDTSFGLALKHEPS